MESKYFLRSYFALLLVSVINAGKLGTKNDHGLSTVVNPDPNYPMMPDAEMKSTKKGIFQGDMLGVLNKDGSVNRNAMADPQSQWDGGRVPYVIDSTANSWEKRKVIDEAIADYNKFTCIKFVPRSNEKDYVKIRYEEGGCYAYMGRSGGEQPINLDDGCWTKGTIIHEMLHTLGFYHEQSRSDRDNYVTVHYNYIPKSWHSQFKKLSPSEENTQGLPYDIESVMHYGGVQFQGFNHPSMTAKRREDQKKMGQRAGFSKQDIQEVNRYYKCQGKTSTLKKPCVDYDTEYCRSLNIDANGKDKWNMCDDAGTVKFCKKTCLKCEKTGGGGGGSGGSSSCVDKAPEYCGTLNIDANGKDPWNMCQDPGTVEFCKKTCLKCGK